MIGPIILVFIIAVFLVAAAIRAGFRLRWSDSLVIAAVIVILCLDGWLLWRANVHLPIILN